MIPLPDSCSADSIVKRHTAPLAIVLPQQPLEYFCFQLPAPPLNHDNANVRFVQKDFMNTGKDHDVDNCTNRREFLKTLIGVRPNGQTTSAAVATQQPGGNFYWADLATGQIGFPTGTTVTPGLPGSIMKLVATAALKEEKLAPDNWTLECTGSVTVGHAKVVCQHAHGQLSLVEALAHSCNVFFAQAAKLLSPEVFVRYSKAFKLNQDVAGFAPGRFPTRPQCSNQSYVLGLADDMQLHALQILQLTALIATRGVLPILHSAEQPPGQSAPLTVTLSDHTWDLLAAGMQLACRQGTASKLDPENRMHLAAKTGTAPHGKTFQSWIAGYFPYDSPRYAFCLRAKAGTSQDQAVPLAHSHLFASEWP